MDKHFPDDLPDDFPDAPGLPEVPGYRVLRRLGVGAHAQVWLAEELTDGGRVALKLAHVGVDGEGARLAGEADLLERVRHDHVVRLRARVPLPGGGLALVLDDAAGGSLADVIAARGRLRPAEVTTVVIAVARALTALHDVGIVHGDVSAGNVLFTAQGRPMLADLGIAAGLASGEPGAGGTPGWADPRSGPGRAGDVWALGALIRFCLTGSTAPVTGGAAQPHPDAATQALLDLARTCCATAAVERPSPTRVAHGAWQACPPRPVELAPARDAVDGPRTPVSRPTPTRRVRPVPVADAALGPARRRPARAWKVAVGLAAGLAVAGAGGFAIRAGGATSTGLAASPATSPTASPATSLAIAPRPAGLEVPEPDLVALVTGLAQARARALAAGSVTALGQVDVPGSPAMSADVAVVQRLTAAGLSLRGLVVTVGEVRLLQAGTPAMRVGAEVTASAHRQVDRQGRLVAAVAAAPPLQIELTLQRTPAGWRVHTAEAS